MDIFNDGVTPLNMQHCIYKVNLNCLIDLVVVLIERNIET